MIRRLAPLALALALAASAGCFKSSTLEGSSESSSDSSSSPFRSSSGGDASAAYRRDVRDYAAGFASAGGDVAVLQRDVGAIARGHGIVDWERDEATFVEIGSGLGSGGVEAERFAEIAKSLADRSDRRRTLLYQGYAATRP